jgi:uncharacterized membrane protein YjjB (DUF3815 family)
MHVINFLPCFYAFAACIGFCVIFNIHGTGILICSFGGALGWLVYLLAMGLGGSVYLASFIAAMAISAYSEGMSRIRKCPVTGYLIVSFFPLVPGAGIYYAMDYCMKGQAAQGLEIGLQTLGIAGCLAVGVLLISTAVRMYKVLLQRRKKA